MPTYHLSVSEDVYKLGVADGVVEWSTSEYVPMHSTDLPDYGGPTDIVPTGSAQVLATAGTAVSADIVIEPIPQNYGLITWDGSVLMVS